MVFRRVWKNNGQAGTSVQEVVEIPRPRSRYGNEKRELAEKSYKTPFKLDLPALPGKAILLRQRRDPETRGKKPQEEQEPVMGSIFVAFPFVGSAALGKPVGGAKYHLEGGNPPHELSC